MYNTAFLEFSRFIPASLSTERAEKLITALGAGYWWAVMEVLRPIDEEPEYDYSLVQMNEIFDAPEASCPSPSGAPVPASSDIGELTSSPVLSKAPKKAKSSHSSLKNTEHCMGKSQMTHEAPMSAPSKSHEVRSPMYKPVQFVSPMEPSLAAELPKRGRLIIPNYLSRQFHKADTALGIPAPALSSKSQAVPPKSSERAPAPLPKLQDSPNGASIPDKVPEVANQKVPKALTQEQQKQNSLISSPKRGLKSLPITEASQDSKSALSKLADFTPPEVGSPKDKPVPSGSTMEASMAAEPPKRGRLTIPHYLARQLHKADTALGMPVPAFPSKVQALQDKSSETAPALSPNGATIPGKVPEVANQKVPKALTQEQQKQNPLISSPKRDLKSLPITKASEDSKSAPSNMVDFTPPEVGSPKDKPVPSGSTMEPSMAAEPPKRGRLFIPHYLALQFHKADTALGRPVPGLPSKVQALPAKSSEKTPASKPKVQFSSNGEPIPGKNPERANQKIPKALTQEEQKQNPPISSPQRGLESFPITKASQDSKSASSKLADFTPPEVGSPKDKPVPSGSTMEAPMAAEPPKRGRLIIPHYLTGHLHKAATSLGMPVPASHRKSKPLDHRGYFNTEQRPQINPLRRTHPSCPRSRTQLEEEARRRQ